MGGAGAEGKRGRARQDGEFAAAKLTDLAKYVGMAAKSHEANCGRAK